MMTSPNLPKFRVNLVLLVKKEFMLDRGVKLGEQNNIRPQQMVNERLIRSHYARNDSPYDIGHVIGFC